MNKKKLFCFFLFGSISFFLCGKIDKNVESKKGLKVGDYMVATKGSVVKKKVLKNGFTILVLESHNIPKVSMQLWFNVGSKDYAIRFYVRYVINKICY